MDIGKFAGEIVKEEGVTEIALEKILVLCWEKYSEVRHAWPDKREFLKSTLPRLVEVIEKDTPPVKEDVDYIFRIK